jgi:hypothetical protein
MGWAHHTRWFVDPEDREPYWTEYHRRRDEAQDAWAEEHAQQLAAGAGLAGMAHPSDPHSAVVVPDLLAPARAGSQGAGGAHSRSQPEDE